LKTPALVCEQCGSQNLRRARLQGLSDAVRAMVGIYPFRCRDCKHRFSISILLWSQLAYAKCPKCLRTDLGTWSRMHYKPGLFSNFLVTFGAQKYRCTQCRYNFVSFRPKLPQRGSSEPK
jgi:DNA-directed RNA polymerase subunit RPC12/RpoP